MTMYQRSIWLQTAGILKKLHFTSPQRDLEDCKQILHDTGP